MIVYQGQNSWVFELYIKVSPVTVKNGTRLVEGLSKDPE